VSAANQQPEQLSLPPDLLEHPVFVMVQLLRLARQRGNSGALGGRAVPRRPGDIRLPHFGVLAILSHFGPSSQREVADRLHFDASDMVAIVDVLEDDGFVCRLRDESDRRRYLLTVTPSGLVALRQTEERARDVRSNFLEPLSQEERASLLDMLNRLYEYHSNLAEQEGQR
jgi:MarR family transcriptional regulator, lower aerobic nicotinate degradation pathway regulator